jgi:Rieske Fe-S protein
VFPDTKVVVTQPAAGTFKAFDAVCPHQGCTVADVRSNQIICPCHGSHFDATTGDRVSGPAQTGLTPKTITVSGDSFTVS